MKASTRMAGKLRNDHARPRARATLCLDALRLLPEALRELQARMPAARLEMIAAAGHLPNIDQPAAFNAALVEFLVGAGLVKA